MIACFLLIVFFCKKDKTTEEKEVVKGNLKEVVETVNGITYKIFTEKNATTFKGIFGNG